MSGSSLVLVHGINSSSTTWASLRAALKGDADLAGYRVVPFDYEARPVRRHGKRRTPTQADVAVQLATHVRAHVPDDGDMVFVAHSQGGLIVQRLIANFLEAGRGGELARVRAVVLLACPNSGSQTSAVARRFARAILNPQETSLRVLNDEIEHCRSVVLSRSVHAQTVSDTTCPITFGVYAGATDGIVTPASAKGLFPSEMFGILPGDHSSILDFSDPIGTGYVSVKAAILTPGHTKTDSPNDAGAASSGSASPTDQPSLTQSNNQGGTGFQGGEHHHYYPSASDARDVVLVSTVPRQLRKRVERAEQTREAAQLGAAEFGAGERIVNAVQRLTLDRRREVVCVESAGVTTARLRHAEWLLRSAGWTGRERVWVAADSRCGLGDLRLLVMAADPDPGVDVGLVAHGPDDGGGDLANSMVSMHLAVCAELGLRAGPTVLVGPAWKVDPDTVRLQSQPRNGQDSASIDDDLDRAHQQGRLAQRIADLHLRPAVALAAVARAGAERADSRYDTLAADLLRVASTSARRAWVAHSTDVRDPAVWSPARDFVIVLVRGQHDPDLPLAHLAPEILREQVLWDEVLRRGPGPLLYAALVAAPDAARAVGLIEQPDGVSA